MNKVLLFFVVLSCACSVYGQSGTEFSFFNNKTGQSQPLIVGHRGGFDADMPENSIEMFDYTYMNSCGKPVGIEFDIRESLSGSLFIMHDSTVDRTTNGNGKISLLPDSYIKTLFLKDKNGNMTTERIPLFLDVLAHFQDQNIILMLDVKGKIYPEVIRLVTEMKMESKCILLTFNLKNTKLVNDATGKIMISALVLNKSDWESLCKLQIPNQQLIAYISKETPPELITEIYQNKVLVMTDMSESIYNKSKHYNSDYYRNFLAKMHMGIMITDYPMYVNNIFCKE